MIEQSANGLPWERQAYLRTYVSLQINDLWGRWMHSLKAFSGFLAICLGLFPTSAVTGEVEDYSDLGLSLPYGFYNQQFGAAAGWVMGRIGFPQPQATILLRTSTLSSAIDTVRCDQTTRLQVAIIGL